MGTPQQGRHGTRRKTVDPALMLFFPRHPDVRPHITPGRECEDRLLIFILISKRSLSLSRPRVNDRTPGWVMAETGHSLTGRKSLEHHIELRIGNKKPICAALSQLLPWTTSGLYLVPHKGVPAAVRGMFGSDRSCSPYDTHPLRMTSRTINRALRRSSPPDPKEVLSTGISQLGSGQELFNISHASAQGRSR